jgi:hypothetical protein
MTPWGWSVIGHGETPKPKAVVRPGRSSHFPAGTPSSSSASITALTSSGLAMTSSLVSRKWSVSFSLSCDETSQLSMDPNRYEVSEPELLRGLRLFGRGRFLRDHP